MDWHKADKVLRYLLTQHLQNGTLGVLAAQTGVPEGEMRNYIKPDNPNQSDAFHHTYIGNATKRGQYD